MGEEALMRRRYENAWHVDGGPSEGVLVEMPGGFWWVLCPATATLVLPTAPDPGDCYDPSCPYWGVHRQASLMIGTQLDG